MKTLSHLLHIGLLATTLGGFSAAQAAAPSPAILAAVANADRPATDRTRDTDRKPAQVIAFFGFAPGDNLFDLFAGGGYFTEILSHLVGPVGHVTAHNNKAYLGFIGDELKMRQAGNRLENVTWILSEANDLTLAPNSLDGVMMSRTYHDFYVTDDKDWPAIDVPKLLHKLYKGLKPGGVLAIVDHRAKAGSGYEACNKLHRIDPEIVKREVIAAGFILEASSDALANPADDHSKSVFDPSIRGKTDQFMLRFRKPLKS